MLNILLAIIMFIGVASAISYSLMSVTTDVQKIEFAQNEKKILDQWESVIINNLKPLSVNQQLAAPFGVNDTTDSDSDGKPDVFYHQMPGGMGLSNLNSYGRPIIYCPVSDLSIPTGYENKNSVWTSTFNENSEYGVGLIQNYDGKKYVIYSDQVMDSSLTGRGIIAIIISPFSREEVIPRCQDVKFNTVKNKYELPGSQVRVITRDRVLSSRIGQPVVLDSKDFIEGVSLDDMLSSWTTMRPLRFILKIHSKSTPYSVTKAISIINDYSGLKEVILIGDGSNSVVINSDSSLLLDFKNINLNIKGIKFGSNLKVRVTDGSLTTEDVVFSGLTINNSKLLISGDTNFGISSSLEPSVLVNSSDVIQKGFPVSIEINGYYGVQMNDSKWLLENSSIGLRSSSSIGRALTMEKGSKLIADNSSVIINSSLGGFSAGDSLVALDSTSFIDMNSSSVSVDDESDIFILNQGTLNLKNVMVGINKHIGTAVYLSNGGTANFNNNTQIGTLSSKPINGVIDRGGKFLFGTNTKIYSSSECWNGNLFTSVASNVTGCSLATNDSYKIFNQSNWSCN